MARHARGLSGRRPSSGRGELAGPHVLGRFLPEPAAAKVPEIVAVFWLVKILTTAAGEAGSDFAAHFGNVLGGGAELLLFGIGAALQLGSRRYSAFAYWSFAYAIAVAGTGVSDFLHLDVKLPYVVTSAAWAVALAAVFACWHRSEGTLSIHSITTRRREAFYWASVFVTFALGTAVGDYTATTLHLGYLDSGVFFAVLIVIPPIAYRFVRGLGSVFTFWASYVLTRPLGASVADYLSKGHRKPGHGLGFGDGPTFAAFTVLVLALVCYLAIARSDIQPPAGPPVPSRLADRATSWEKQ